VTAAPLPESQRRAPSGPEHLLVRDPLHSLFWRLPEGVTLVEPDGVSPGVTFPAGLLAGAAAAGLKPSGKPDVAVLSVGSDWWDTVTSAAVFTSNAFAAAPVIVSQRETSPSKLSAVVANSGSANACTGQAGLAVARAMQAACARGLRLEEKRVGVASTGVIGTLPAADRVQAGIEAAVRDMTADGGGRFLEAIMTTDRFPKACALEVVTHNGVVRVGGCVKGAGMIAPGMATMLCFVTTDAVLTPALARSMLRREVGRTFNKVSVDGQMSTNDCVFFLATGASRVYISPAGAAQLGAAVRALLQRLALMIVADGEGATKVMHLRVRGAARDEEAMCVARAVANSSLVKTAMYGCDPNWGRILSAAGAELAGQSLGRTYLEIGGLRVVENARALPLAAETQRMLREVMARSEVDLLLHLGSGRGREEMYFSDLGHEYVTVNAEYTT